MRPVHCFRWILVCERQTESHTGTTIVAASLCASMCSCECFCETESVWGLAEWETSILFGHTAESHSPYSPTLTFWNGLPVCDCFFYHATQASLPSRSFFLHHFAISQGALGSPGSLISLLINICYSSPAFFPLEENITLLTSSAPLRLIIRAHSSVVGERKRQMEKVIGEKIQQEQCFFAFILEVNMEMFTTEIHLQMCMYVWKCRMWRYFTRLFGWFVVSISESEWLNSSLLKIVESKRGTHRYSRETAESHLTTIL